MEDTRVIRSARSDNPSNVRFAEHYWSCRGKKRVREYRVRLDIRRGKQTTGVETCAVQIFRTGGRFM
jgi:hypothetical protein